VVDAILALCCRVPIIKNSVLDGLRVNLLDVNQECTMSRVEDRAARWIVESEPSNDR
jgi:hypothetical protein